MDSESSIALATETEDIRERLIRGTILIDSDGLTNHIIRLALILPVFGDLGTLDLLIIEDFVN